MDSLLASDWFPHSLMSSNSDIAPRSESTMRQTQREKSERWWTHWICCEFGCPLICWGIRTIQVNKHKQAQHTYERTSMRSKHRQSHQHKHARTHKHLHGSTNASADARTHMHLHGSTNANADVITSTHTQAPAWKHKRKCRCTYTHALNTLDVMPCGLEILKHLTHTSASKHRQSHQRKHARTRKNKHSEKHKEIKQHKQAYAG